MVCCLLDNENLLKTLKIYKNNLGKEPEGNKLFNIYDCKFFVNIYIDDKIIPLETSVEYYKKCNISNRNNFNYITLVSKPLNNDKIKVKPKNILGFSISCQYCKDCKEYLIKKIEKHISVPYINEDKRKKLEDSKIKFSLKGNLDYGYYNYFENGNLYLNNFKYVINKNYIKNKYIPYFGENYNNPLFKIEDWEIEAHVNNHKLLLSKLENTDLPQENNFYKKNLYIYFTPKGNSNALNECEIKYNDILSFSIFVTFNKEKIRIKKFSNIPIGKLLIDSINKKYGKKKIILRDVLDNIEVKYKNNLYFGSYMLRPGIITQINGLRKNNNYSEIQKLEKNKKNYYYNLQYVRCNLSTDKILDSIIT